MTKLQIGDVFEVTDGFKVYTKVPETVAYSNGKYTNKHANMTITVGKQYQHNNGTEYPTYYLTGYYVVEDAKMTGGGTGHGPHDIYPDGWHITARQLNDAAEYDPNGVEISFFQSGAFTIVHEDIPVIKTMERIFI